MTGDAPKPLVSIYGKPFLEWLLISLRRRGVRRAVLCTGFGHDLVEAALGDGSRLRLRLTYSVERGPYGTAGAAALALPLLADPFVLWNGDTYSTLDWRALLTRHVRTGALVTIAITRVAEASEFGRVVVDGNDRVTTFQEKVGAGPAFINAGAYVVSHAALRWIRPGRACSLEREVLPGLTGTGRVYAHRTRSPVFDVGTPDRLDRFKREVARGDLVYP